MQMSYFEPWNVPLLPYTLQNKHNPVYVWYLPRIFFICLLSISCLYYYFFMEIEIFCRKIFIGNYHNRKAFYQLHYSLEWCLVTEELCEDFSMLLRSIDVTVGSCQVRCASLLCCKEEVMILYNRSHYKDIAQYFIASLTGRIIWVILIGYTY